MIRIPSRSGLALIIALQCSGVLLPGPAAAARAVEVDRIAAVVNNEVITTLELRERVAQITRQLQRQGTQLPPADVLERQLLERIVLERAQMQLAKESGIQADDATLERAIGRIAENNRMSLTDLRAALEKDGITWNQFRDQIRSEIVMTRLREREVENRVVVTDSEIDNYLANNPEGLSNEEFQLAHILVRLPEGANQRQLMERGARAESIITRLRAGEDFGKLAAEYSDAPDALSGGALGWRTRDRVPALFADQVNKLRPGEVSGILRSAAGLHIVKLVDKRGGGSAGPVQMQQTRARHILIRTSEIVSDAEAESRLRALRERIVNGGSFADLAKANSGDLSSAKGGDLGWLNPGDTVPEFERAMDALKPGEVSQPVKSPFGWHLIMVEGRRMQDVSDERKRNAARAALRARKSDEAFEEWLRQLRDRTYVEYRLDKE